MSLVALSEDGRAIVEAAVDSSAIKHDLATGAETPIGNVRALDRSLRYGVEVLESGVRVIDLQNGARTTYDTSVMFNGSPVSVYTLSALPVISRSGRFVMVLAASGVLGIVDQFLVDRVAGTVTRLGSLFSGCTVQIGAAAIAGDDSAVFFGTFASGPGCQPDVTGWHSWRVPATGGIPVAVSFLANGDTPKLGSVPRPTNIVAVSTSGRFVLFYTDADNLAPDGDGTLRLFRLDTQTSTSELVSSGVEPRGLRGGPTMTDDGDRIAYLRDAPTITDGVTVTLPQVFVTEMSSNRTVELSAPPGGTASARTDNSVVITGDGNAIAFISFANDLVTAGSTSADGNVFVATLDTGTEIVPRVPERILDTREPIGVPVVARLDASSTIELPVAGTHGVANDANGVVLNVSVDQPLAAGFLTVWPCGQPRPTASNLNFTAGQTIPNLVFATIGSSGKVCIFASEPTHVIADLAAVLPSTAHYSTLNPVRVLDTREPIGVPTAVAVAAGSTLHLPIRGKNGVPLDARAVALNVTVDQPAAAGYLTVHPCLGTLPVASNRNYSPGQTVPNAVLTTLSPDGAICLTTQQTTHVIVDLDGYVQAASTYVPRDPSRLLDTREAIGVTTRTPVATGEVLALAVADGIHAPTTSSAAVLNVTVDQPAGAGFVTVWPCGQERPLASNLNFSRNTTIPNLVLATIGEGGKVYFYATQTTHLVVDLGGYFPAG